MQLKYCLPRKASDDAYELPILVRQRASAFSYDRQYLICVAHPHGLPPPPQLLLPVYHVFVRPSSESRL